MKKLCVAFAIIMTAATVLLLSSCSTGIKNLSERRGGFFYATDGKYEVTAVSGVRERDYVMDGAAGELKPYTLVTFMPLSPSDFDVDGAYTYEAVITIDGADGKSEKKFGGALAVHPFSSSFSAEFDFEATCDFTVTVDTGKGKLTYKLGTLVPADAVDYERAVQAALSALEPVEPYEIRVKLIKNPLEKNNGELCWHVSFISEDGVCGALLDPVTAKVIAVKQPKQS